MYVCSLPISFLFLSGCLSEVRGVGEYGLGQYVFCILSIKMQVQTVERALTVGSIINGEVHLFSWGFLGFFPSFNYSQINDEVFEHVTTIKHVQYTLFFQLKWANFLKMI